MYYYIILLHISNKYISKLNYCITVINILLNYIIAY